MQKQQLTVEEDPHGWGEFLSISIETASCFIKVWNQCVVRLGQENIK